MNQRKENRRLSIELVESLGKNFPAQDRINFLQILTSSNQGYNRGAPVPPIKNNLAVSLRARFTSPVRKSASWISFSFAAVADFATLPSASRSLTGLRPSGNPHPVAQLTAGSIYIRPTLQTDCHFFAGLLENVLKLLHSMLFRLLKIVRVIRIVYNQIYI